MPADISNKLGDKLPSISNTININNGVSSVGSGATMLTKNEEELQTRVSELELVNDLLKSRIGQLEDSEAAARESESIVRKSEMMLRVQVNKLEHRLERYRKRSNKNFSILDDDDDYDDDNSDLRLDDSRHKSYAVPSQRKSEPSSVMMMLQPDKTEPLKKKLKTV
ncbi:hypothetical protein D0Z03_002148 [Geotrichum reessii]|nr:hypothetical protein D0Z03_002148 [Galactomyces reessii]